MMLTINLFVRKKALLKHQLYRLLALQKHTMSLVLEKTAGEKSIGKEGLRWNLEASVVDHCVPLSVIPMYCAHMPVPWRQGTPS